MSETKIDIHDVQEWLLKATPEEIQETIGIARGILAVRPKRAPRKDAGVPRTKTKETAQERILGC